MASSKSGHGYGTPYPRAFDLLIEVYEGGYSAALDAIASADPERGPAYVRGVLERSERPLLCPRPYPRDPAPGCEGWRWQDDARDTPWCEAGRYLFKEGVAEARARTPDERLVWAAGYPRPIPDGLPEEVEDWHRRCL